MNLQRLTKSKLNELQVRYGRDAAIAKVLCCSRQTVGDLRRKFDLPISKVRTEARNKRIISLYNDKGMTGVQVAEKVKLAPAQVYRILEEAENNGVALRKKDKWKRLLIKEPTHDVSRLQSQTVQSGIGSGGVCGTSGAIPDPEGVGDLQENAVGSVEAA